MISDITSSLVVNSGPLLILQIGCGDLKPVTPLWRCSTLPSRGNRSKLQMAFKLNISKICCAHFQTKPRVGGYGCFLVC